MRRYTAWVLCVLITGCAGSRGLHPDVLRDLLTREASRFAGSSSTANRPAHLPATRGATLGLYLNPTGFIQREFEWTERDRDILLTWAAGLQKAGTFANTKMVSQSSLRGNSLGELRESAMRYGTDLLIVLDGASEVDRYNNFKAPLLYWTILGAYLADGTHSNALCLLRGTVWDVKSGSLLFQEEAEGRSQIVGPAAFVDNVDMVNKARHQALSQLLETLKNRLAPPPSP